MKRDPNITELRQDLYHAIVNNEPLSEQDHASLTKLGPQDYWMVIDSTLNNNRYPDGVGIACDIINRHPEIADLKVAETRDIHTGDIHRPSEIDKYRVKNDSLLHVAIRAYSRNDDKELNYRPLILALIKANPKGLFEANDNGETALDLLMHAKDNNLLYKELCNLISKDTTIEDLDLSKYKLSREQAELLATAIKENTTIKSVKIDAEDNAKLPHLVGTMFAGILSVGALGQLTGLITTAAAAEPVALLGITAASAVAAFFGAYNISRPSIVHDFNLSTHAHITENTLTGAGKTHLDKVIKNIISVCDEDVSDKITVSKQNTKYIKDHQELIKSELMHHYTHIAKPPLTPEKATAKITQILNDILNPHPADPASTLLSTRRAPVRHAAHSGSTPSDYDAADGSTEATRRYSK